MLRLIRPSVIVSTAILLCQSLHAIPVRVLAWDSEIAAMNLAIGDSKGNKKIEAMHPSKRTGYYQVSAGENPAVIVALDKKGPDGKPATSPITFPEGVKQPLLVILPDEKSPTGVRPFILNDDTSGFAWGSIRFINALGKEVIFVHEKKGLPLPSSWTPVQLNPGGETRNFEAKIYTRDKQDRPLYSAIWEYSTEQRVLVFLVPSDDPRLGPVNTKMISEDRRVEKAPPAEDTEAKH